jgi:hypothetical protein
MLRACVTCMGMAQNCTPDTNDPINPEYARDCRFYNPIPETLYLMLADKAPNVWRAIKAWEKIEEVDPNTPTNGSDDPKGGE